MAQSRLSWDSLSRTERTLLLVGVAAAGGLVVLGLAGDSEHWWVGHAYLLNLISSLTAFSIGAPLALVMFRRAGPLLELRSQEYDGEIETIGNLLAGWLERAPKSIHEPRIPKAEVGDACDERRMHVLAVLDGGPYLTSKAGLRARIAGVDGSEPWAESAVWIERWTRSVLAELVEWAPRDELRGRWSRALGGAIGA